MKGQEEKENLTGMPKIVRMEYWDEDQKTDEISGGLKLADKDEASGEAGCFHPKRPPPFVYTSPQLGCL